MYAASEIDKMRFINLDLESSVAEQGSKFPSRRLGELNEGSICGQAFRECTPEDATLV